MKLEILKRDDWTLCQEHACGDTAFLRVTVGEAPRQERCSVCAAHFVAYGRRERAHGRPVFDGP